jgi:hypothetical protein
MITQQLEKAFTSLSYYVRALDCLSAVVQCMLLDSVVLQYLTNYVLEKKIVTGGFV